MQVLFFPGPLFAWTFLAVLLLLLLAASFTDLGRMVVPKQVTLTALALGLVFNLVRGALLGNKDLAVWMFAPGGPVLGAADGLLFGLAGFALGFVLFFTLWIVGVCGGGDVKLFAALGSWVGPTLAIFILAMTLVVVTGFVFAGLALRLVRGQGMRLRKGAAKQPKRRLLGFSLPLAIATAVVLLWAFRVDLQFVAAPVVATAGTSHAN